MTSVHPLQATVSIRLFKRRDIKEAHRVRLSVQENRLTSTVITEQDYIDAVTRTGCGWVAEIDGVIRGFAIANRETCSVWALFVEPGFERRGIGRALHDVMLEWMRSAGCESAWLETEPGTRAEAFYRQAGWQPAGVTAKGDARFERPLIQGKHG